MYKKIEITVLRILLFQWTTKSKESKKLDNYFDYALEPKNKRRNK